MDRRTTWYIVPFWVGCRIIMGRLLNDSLQVGALWSLIGPFSGDQRLKQRCQVWRNEEILGSTCEEMGEKT